MRKRLKIIICAGLTALQISVKAQSTSLTLQSEKLTEKAFSYLSKRDFENTLLNCERALKLNPKNCYAYFYIGDVNYFKGSYQTATVNYIKSISYGCRDGFTYSRIAECFHQLKDYTESFKYYELALKSSKGEDLGIVFMARCNARIELLDWNGAFKDINKALIYLTFNNSLCYLYRGKILLNLKKYTEALADLNRSIELQPGEYFDAYLNRGKTLLKLGNKDAACEDFEFAYKLNQNFTTAQAINENCRKL